MFPAHSVWQNRLASWLMKVGPVAAIALLVPGGTAIALLTWALRHRSVFSRSWLRIAGICLLASAPLAFADPAPDAARTVPAANAEHSCVASSAEQARSLGDVLFEHGAYQNAGQCYIAAGDYSRANLAFLKAAAPQSAIAARDFADTRNSAKEQAQRIRRNLHRSW